MNKFKTYFKDRPYLSKIVIVAVVLRLGFMIFALEHHYNPIFPIQEIDAKEYYQIGLNLAQHGAFSQSKVAPLVPDSFRTPVYPAIVALSFLLTGDVWMVAILQILFSALTVLLVYELGRKFLPHKYSLLPAALIALDPVGMVYTSLLMTETLFLLLLTLALYLFIDESKEYSKFAWLGIILGIATLTRPIGLLLPAIFILLHLFWERTWKPALVLLAAFVLVITPWSIRNKREFGSYSLAAVSSYNIYYYNALRFWASENNKSLEDAWKIFDQNLVAKYGPGSTAATLKNEKIFTHEGLAIIMSSPIKYGIFHIKTLVPFFFTDGLREISELIGLTERRYVDLRSSIVSGDIKGLYHSARALGPELLLLLVGSIFWIGVSLFSVIGLVRRRRDWGVWTLFLMAAVLALLSGVVTTVRFRYAISSLLFILATIGIHEVINRYPILQRGRHNQGVN